MTTDPSPKLSGEELRAKLRHRLALALTDELMATPVVELAPDEAEALASALDELERLREELREAKQHLDGIINFEVKELQERIREARAERDTALADLARVREELANAKSSVLTEIKKDSAVEFVQAECDALRADLERAREDTRRLDWLEIAAEGLIEIRRTAIDAIRMFANGHPYYGNRLREAIDSTRTSGAQEGGEA